jgi:hypothetical protein
MENIFVNLTLQFESRRKKNLHQFKDLKYYAKEDNDSEVFVMY